MGTKWDQGGTAKDMALLDFSNDKGGAGDATTNGVETSEAEVSIVKILHIATDKAFFSSEKC